MHLHAVFCLSTWLRDDLACLPASGYSTAPTDVLTAVFVEKRKAHRNRELVEIRQGGPLRLGVLLHNSVPHFFEDGGVQLPLHGSLAQQHCHARLLLRRQEHDKESARRRLP